MGKGESTRRRIIEAAAGLMNRRGWLATPVSAILTATNLQKGGLYRHFTGMHELAGEAFVFASGQLMAVVQTRLGSNGSSRDRLINLLAAFSLVGDRRPPFDAGCPILNAATETDDLDDGLRERVAQVARRIIASVEAVIAEGVRSGEFRYGLDPRRSAQMLFAAFEGGVMLAGVTRDPSLFGEIKDDMVRLVDAWLVVDRAPA